MDAIELLKGDHREVEKLFKAYEEAGDRAFATKEELVGSIIRELSIHAEIEELLFYPAARRAAAQTTSLVLESLEEHLGAKHLLADLDKMDATDERYDAKVSVLTEQIRHHVKEEEEELFPAVSGGLSKETLAELGDEMEAAKGAVPTRPHPHSPDTPPGNAVTGLPAALVDRTRDFLDKLTS